MDRNSEVIEHCASTAPRGWQPYFPPRVGVLNKLWATKAADNG